MTKNTKLSANLGFLWTDRPLPDAIVAAKQAGFDAVECHFPYSVPAQDVVSVLNDTGLSMLSLNTIRGDVDAGDNGLCALPDRESDARAAIDQAIDYAMQIGAGKIHVMAGKASGEQAHQQYLKNLRYAVQKIQTLPLTILIEPLNHYDAPDYYLSTTVQAEGILSEIGSERIKLLFDFYHVQTMQGNVSRLFALHLSSIGHVQIAAVPDRGPPDGGELNYRHVLNMIYDAGYTDPIGAEYKPGADTNASLSWMNSIL